MSYKWEAMVEDLTVERNRLREALKKCLTGCEVALDQFERAGIPAPTYRDAVDAAREALKETS